MPELNTVKRYSIDGWRGVAFRFVRYQQRWEPYLYSEIDPETGDETDVESYEGEWVEDPTLGKAVMVMVGDDKEHLECVEDIEELDDLDYCLECGQIGCTHDGRDRT